ncbi:MAG: hypothetical protein NTW80_10680 [Deltaproteobacteria bacterium]|nr:hypothetical protein [Deltaproteobacteria bacterium]
MDNSLREMLWLQWHGQLPPPELLLKEVLLALLVAGLLLASWLVVRRWCFYLAQRARPARLGAWILCATLALTWLVASLDLFDFRSLGIALILLILGLATGMIYLMTVKYKKSYSH